MENFIDRGIDHLGLDAQQRSPRNRSHTEPIKHRPLSSGRMGLVERPDLEQKLSPRDMFALDAKMEEQNNYFTCTICLKVVLEPRECSKCNNLFCFDCLADWDKVPLSAKKSNEFNGRKHCPMQCQDPVYKLMHRFSNQALLSKNFKCPYESLGCQDFMTFCDTGLSEQCVPSNFSMTYFQALEHMSSCDFKPVPCPLECGAQVPQTRMQGHIKNCNNLTIRCDKCELSVKARMIESGDHDCFQALKEHVKALEEQKAKNDACATVLDELGLSLLAPRPKCSKGHTMKYQKSNPYIDGRVSCDSCSYPKAATQYIDKHDVFFHCAPCQTDMCQACSLIQQGLIAYSQNVTCHGHALKKNRDRGNWMCNAVDLNKGCASKMKKFSESHKFQHWTCKTCDFDLCLKCMIKYKN